MKHPLYKLYLMMKNRCYCPTNKKYREYGGRGILVCDRWLGIDGFTHFLEDMGDRPKGTSLDRKDNDGNYEPGNCRWATAHQQSANRRNNAKTPGVTFTTNRGTWRAELKVNRAYVLCKQFHSYADAVEARKQAERKYGIVYGMAAV